MAKAITGASAQKILAKDLENVRAKVTQGKPLTARERALIQQAGDDKKEAATVNELLALLNLARSSYYAHKKKKGCPQDLNLEAWREFLSLQQLGKLDGKVLTPQQIAQLKGRLLAERTGREKVERKLKELKLEREAGGWVPIEAAQDSIIRVLEPLNRLLDGVPKAYAMRVNPSDADFAEEMLREMVQEIKGQISQARGEKISKRKGVK